MSSGRQYQTTFVGREELLAELTRRITEPRSLVLVGPGGVGKTRLAVEAARATAKACPFIDLTNVRGASELLAVWCGALRLPPASRGGGDADAGLRIARALDASAPHVGVCIVDNCDDLDGAGVAALGAIARAARTPLLLTSRRPTGLESEDVLLVSVPPLAREDASALSIAPSPAFRLLAERSGVAPERWWSSPTDREAVERILRHLDGLPLAIELAAWRLRLVAPGELAARVDSLLPLLVQPAEGEHDEPERHRSLEALIHASWRALDSAERTLLAVIAELPAGATLEELEAAGGPSSMLAAERLVARSLVLNGERFVPYETVRAYVARKTTTKSVGPGELPDVSEALARVWAHLAARAADATLRLERDGDPAMTSWLIGARQNLERALEALPPGPALDALYGALTATFLRVGFPTQWPSRILAFCEAKRDGDVAIPAPLATACATTLRHIGRYEDGLAWATWAHAAARPGAERARAAIELSLARFRGGDVSGAVEALDDADREAASEPSEALLAQLAARRANVMVRSSKKQEVDQALAFAERGQRGAARAGCGAIEAECEHMIAWVLFEMGRPAEAVPHYARFAELSEAAQEYGEASYAVVQGAMASFGAGDVMTALAGLGDGLTRARRSGHMRAEALALAMRALVRHTSGSVREAEADYRDALRFGLLATDAWLGPFFLACYGAASAELGDEAIAERRLEDAARAIEELPESTRVRRYGATLVGTASAVLVVAEAKRAQERGDEAGADRAIRRARAALARCNAAIEEHAVAELRVVAAVLAHALAPFERSTSRLRVGREGRWFRVGAHDTVDLDGKPTLARLAQILAEAHIRGEREPLPRSELIKRMWPDERIDPAAAANRLSVTLSKLRSLGLASELDVSRHGVRLRSDLVVHLEGQSS